MGWGDIQQRVHQSQLHSVDELKKRLLQDVWHVMDQSVIDDAIDECRNSSSMWTKGGHFELVL